MKYEYEREAARGDPMPEEIESLAEQTAYQAIRYLYAAYRAKRVTQEEAGKEKAKILMTLRQEREREVLLDKVQTRSAEMMKNLEAAANRYGTERTLENADKLIEAIHNTALKKG